MEHQADVGIGETSTLAATITAGPAGITPSMMAYSLVGVRASGAQR
jgi:hypothetical protein